MMTESPKILALDFDGVICDGMREYFQSSKLAYQNIWHPDHKIDLDASRFYQLRPVIEHGWEMPVLIRGLILGFSDQDILDNWLNISQEIVRVENLDPKNLAIELDRVRDQWINSDFEGWLNFHDFYGGVIEKIRSVLNSPTHVYIVTTKGERFVRKLLEKQGLSLPENSIIGKEVKRPKPESLRYLLEIHNELPHHLWFVEDFLKPLKLVQQYTDLEGIRLYLADWGYNTQGIRRLVKEDDRIKLLSLGEFSQDFAEWPL